MADKIQIRSEHTATGLTNVSKIITPIAKQLLGQNGFFMVDLLSNWQALVGKNLATYALPVKLAFAPNSRRDGCLTIATIGGAFAMEIKQQERSLIAKINVFFGYEAISKIKIIQTANPEDFAIYKKPIENLQKNVVSVSEENYITELIKDIRSPELREALQKIGQAVATEADN